MKMKGSHYGRKGMNGAYAKSKGGTYGAGGNPLKGRKMPRGPKDPRPSHAGSRK
ncbi:MAG: hypothetical protein ACR2RE_29975 [Geminicoccaceae bacterium]